MIFSFRLRKVTRGFLAINHNNQDGFFILHIGHQPSFISESGDVVNQRLINHYKSYQGSLWASWSNEDVDAEEIQEYYS